MKKLLAIAFVVLCAFSAFTSAKAVGLPDSGQYTIDVMFDMIDAGFPFDNETGFAEHVPDVGALDKSIPFQVNGETAGSFHLIFDESGNAIRYEGQVNAQGSDPATAYVAITMPMILNVTDTISANDAATMIADMIKEVSKDPSFDGVSTVEKNGFIFTLTESHTSVSVTPTYTMNWYYFIFCIEAAE